MMNLKLCFCDVEVLMYSLSDSVRFFVGRGRGEGVLRVKAKKRLLEKFNTA